ncbi:MAG: DUF4430 domain-containing protein [Clostridiales Family XIII bacterium]|jgi:hypothetical protein|nr:DUF4430 domain-containing protein [Clostridiales Family XIII bacterium]
MKKMSTIKRFAVVFALLLAAMSFAACGGGSGAASGNATVSIDCVALAEVDPDLAGKYSEEGWIAAVTEIEITDGLTVLDTLDLLDVDFVDTGGYVSEINGLGHEASAGDFSGWLFLVNGEMPSVGAGELKVSDGDVIEWRYSCDGGPDIGLSWE